MWKRLACLLAALWVCAAGALGEGGTFALRFDEGFALSLPEGWVSYPAGEGPIRYALGPGDGAHFLYILAQPTQLGDFEAMRAAIEAHPDCDRTSPLALNGVDFAAFVAPGLNASGVATLHDGELLTFLFTPQDDSDYIMQVAEIMGSFRTA